MLVDNRPPHHATYFSYIRVNSRKTQIEHNESALTSIADMRADIDLGAQGHQLTSRRFNQSVARSRTKECRLQNFQENLPLAAWSWTLLAI